MSIVWENHSSIRSGEPRVLVTNVEGIVIKIHRHKDYPETWFLTCYDMNIEKHNLYTDDFKEAEKKAMLVMIKRINIYRKVADELIARRVELIYGIDGEEDYNAKSI